MGQAVELVEELRRRLFDAAGGIELTPDAPLDAFAEAIAPYVADDFVVTMAGGALTTAREGLTGLREGWEDFLSGFERMRIEPRELFEGGAGESAVEFVQLTGFPRGSAGAIEQPAAAVWRVRDARLHAVEFHLDRAAALRAGGLDPHAPPLDVRADPSRS